MSEFLYRIFYNIIFVPLMLVSYRVFSLFNRKAKEGLRGRKKIFEVVRERISASSKGARANLPIIWFHCASVGEFEQARPIISACKERARIMVSFFSPSGYSVAERYPHADILCYLPLDTARNARRMFRIVDPALLIFVKFDVWPNYIWEASRSGVPVILVDATLHKESRRLFPGIRSFLRSVHKHINLHCAISESDARRFERICPKGARIEVVGDTRFDQVIARKRSAGKKLEGLLPHFELPVMIAGSTYAEDEIVVLSAYQRVLNTWGKAQLILVPHEPEPERLREIEDLMSQQGLSYLRLSDIERGIKPNGEVIIIDRVGLLAELYLLGDIAFVGGSFHGSVHNVMEPAIMGKPVLFGPTIQNSLEAYMLMERGAGIMVKDSEEMALQIIKLLSDDALRERLGKSAQIMIEENAGATDKIVAYIDEFLHSP